MRDRRNKKKAYFSYLLRVLVAVSALYLAFRGEDLSKLGEVLLSLNLWVFAAAIAIYILGQLIFVARWSLLLRVQSIHIGFWVAVRLHFLGLFYNNCLPGAVGGDLPRAWYVTKHTDKKVEAALSVFFDRLVGLTGMIIMALGCYWFIPAGQPNQTLELSFKGDFLAQISRYKWILFAIAVAFAAIIAALVSTTKGKTLMHRALELIRSKSTEILAKVRRAIIIYYSRKLVIAWALVLTFCCQSMHVLAMWLMGREIGITVNIKYYYIFFPISWLLGAVPVSVGGLGIMEGWLKLMFMRVGTMTSGKALALALSQRLILLVASLPGVAIHVLGAHLPKDFFIDYDKGVN